MVETLWVISFILVLILTVIVVGLLVYAFSPNVKSWEEGVKKVMTFGFEQLYEIFTGRQVESKQVDTSIILTFDEVMMLKNKLAKQPFDNPVLSKFVPKDDRDISCYSFESLGVSKEYENLSHDELTKMCKFIIRDFFVEHRGHCPEFYIQVSSPTFLRFLVPISIYGSQKLKEEIDLRKTTEKLSETKVLQHIKEEIKVPAVKSDE